MLHLKRPPVPLIRHDGREARSSGSEWEKCFHDLDPDPDHGPDPILDQNPILDPDPILDPIYQPYWSCSALTINLAYI